MQADFLIARLCRDLGQQHHFGDRHDDQHRRRHPFGVWKPRWQLRGTDQYRAGGGGHIGHGSAIIAAMFSHSQTSRQRNIALAGLGLLSLSGLFLWLQHLTHIEFLAHLAAIPLEILVGAVVVERWLANKEKQARRRQFMYLKSYIFRSGMRSVFVSNFAGLVEPKITLEWLRTASPRELRAARDGIVRVRHVSPAVVDGILDKYVHARKVFLTFMDWAVQNDFEPIFHDMIFLLHFIEDVEAFRQQHPGQSFSDAAARNPRLQAKVDKVLRDGIVKFLDYAIEMREQEPAVFDDLLEDYLNVADSSNPVQMGA
jgi:hypothetical protein